jgi:hypothetical protein
VSAAGRVDAGRLAATPVNALKCRELGLDASGTGAAGGVVPTSWARAIGTTPPAWWSPSKDTPPAACARRHGQSGWIAAKLEGPVIYLIATDMPKS